MGEWGQRAKSVDKSAFARMDEIKSEGECVSGRHKNRYTYQGLRIAHPMKSMHVFEVPPIIILLPTSNDETTSSLRQFVDNCLAASPDRNRSSVGSK